MLIIIIMKVLIIIIWSVFILLEQETNLNHIKKYGQRKIVAILWCHLKHYIKILEFNQCQKLDKAPFIHLGCLVKKNDEFKNNLKNTSSAKVVEHILSIFSISTISSIKSIENRHMYTPVRTVWKRFANP